MDFKEFQDKSSELIKKIDAKYSGKHDIETTIIHLIEELGEVAQQLYNQKIGRDKLDKENLAEEIADCMILLSKLASNFDIDLAKSIEDTFQKLKKRYNIANL